MADPQTMYTGQTAQGGIRSQEKRFLDLLDRMRNNTAGVYCVHLHLSELRPSHRQPHFMRMVGRSLDTLANQQDVKVFNFANSDVVLLCRNTPVDDVDDAVFRVRALFNEDPLAQTEDGSAEDKFSSWYDFSQPNDFHDLEVAIKTILEAREDLRAQQIYSQSSGRASQIMTGEPLTPDLLNPIQKKLMEVRVGDLVHRQPAVTITGGKKQDLAFREHFIAMNELRERVCPDVNLFSGHWLFQYLSETIDARVLEVLSRFDFMTMEHAISVNLNLSTVMARPFQNFHAVVNDNSDKVIVEIQIIDIFADMDNYEYTRDWLHDHGYRVLIDGLNPLTLEFFDPTPLKADFIKMSWGPDLRGGVRKEQSQAIRQVVAKMKRGAAILARVDNEEAVSWGLGLGILSFQGHFIDKVVHKMAERGLIA
ncbi:MAG: hypothetical protein HQL35_10550 [Alphaproteobacteria bacterium]|nr:hypothetical protein [Alphaproteobacteria bacterium]